jgi:hypothetical protein
MVTRATQRSTGQGGNPGKGDYVFCFVFLLAVSVTVRLSAINHWYSYHCGTDLSSTYKVPAKVAGTKKINKAAAKAMFLMVGSQLRE